MTWIQRYRFREYVRNSMWITPLCFVIFFGIAGALVWRLDRRLGWSLLGFRPGGALAAMAAIVGAMLTFTGFVFSILLVAVQFASAQLTPRVLKASLRDRFTKFALGTFRGTSYYALTILSRITEDFVP